MKNINKNKIIISGGGTGGHIYPAISIANALKKKIPDIDILFVGALGNMEMQKIPASGYTIVGLPIKGFKRKGPLKNISVIIKLIYSLIKAKQIINSFKPDAVIGVGGYASGPVLKIATQKKIPTLIQEQNSYAGITNRILAKKVNKICVAYDQMSKYFPSGKIILTGNPVRMELENSSIKRHDAISFFELDQNRKTLLILGGSLGARTINQCVLDNLGMLTGEDIQVIWQTGSRYFEDIKLQMTGNALNHVKVTDFISRMDLAYAASDLVITRSGAGTISELCLVAKPSILVPSPNVAEDHQTKNAEALMIRNAAIVVKDMDAGKLLIPTAMTLIRNEVDLHDLSENISKLAQRDAANRIADEVLSLIHRA